MSGGQGASGDFLWPQLDSSSGTPQRVLQAFLTKNLKGRTRWFVAEEMVVEQISPWLDMPEQLQVIPAIHAAVTDPQAKQQLWQALAK